MSDRTIDSLLLSKMFLAGARSLEAKKEWINELNVFPVPDGDTGTNMSLTIESAAKEVEALTDVTMEKLAKAISSGSLRGARGNSGVILSQLFRGFSKGIRQEKELDREIIAAAAQKAVETAYKAVMKPKEGTILTVARAASEEAVKLLEEEPEISMDDYLLRIVDTADEMLARTPDMLPVLKEAGVVDSGGQGLIQFLRGAYNGYMGIEEELPEEAVPETIAYGYRMIFDVYLQKAWNEKTNASLAMLLSGAGKAEDLTHKLGIVHIETLTDDPGRVLTGAAGAGTLYSVRIENLKPAPEPVTEEPEEKAGEEQPRKDVGFITVATGEGIASIFRELGADYLIEGGQTMNPSTDDMLGAIAKVNADNIFIFPNNKNIILAANQARNMTEDKNIIVVPTKTIPQGITALINYIPEKSPEENEALMNEEISGVRTGQITYAVRNTHVDDKEIHEGDIMGVGDSGILAVGKEITDTAVETAALMVTEETELISIYYGDGIKEEEAQQLADILTEKYPSLDVELNNGGQPVYYYIISAE